MRFVVPSARVFGPDLSDTDRQEHGLSARQLAFWQKYPVSAQATAAGIKENDIVLGFDGETLEMDAYDFLRHVERNYLAGDQVEVNIIRGDKRLNLPMTLR